MDKAEAPALSIIVATYNSSATLRACLDSLPPQEAVAYELLVVDGGSSDATVAIAQGYAPTVLLSEADRGIGDAWNKALARAQGEVVAFLNSDDAVPEGYFPARLAHLKQCGPGVVTYADTLYLGRSGPELRPGRFRPERLELGFGFYHTSTLWPRPFFDRFRFNPELRVAVDIDQMFMALRQGWRFEKGPGHNLMRAGGVSDRRWGQGVREYRRLFVVHARPGPLGVLLSYVKAEARILLRRTGGFALLRWLRRLFLPSRAQHS